MRLSLHTPAAVFAVALLGPLATLPPLAWGASFRTVPGSSDRVGSGMTYRFKVQVQRSVDIDRRKFAGAVEEVLFDDRGWTRKPNWWPKKRELRVTRKLHAGTTAAVTKGAAIE